MKPFNSLKVLVAGDVMLDRYWFGDANRISPEAPVPVVKIDRIEERLGGAANVARNVASVGVKSVLVSVLGKDEAANSMKVLLDSSGIENRIKEDPNLITTIKIRIVGRQQQLIWLDFEEEPRGEVLAASMREFESAVKDCDVVILSDYGKGGLKHIKKMIQIANSLGIPVVVDPKGDDFSRYEGAKIITPNRDELFKATGIKEDDVFLQKKVSEVCKENSIDSLLLTLSEKGMTLFDNKDGEFHVPALAQEVYDVSGAGDTVIAILGVMLAAGESLQDSVSWANKAAGLVVAKLGTAVVSSDELFGDRKF